MADILPALAVAAVLLSGCRSADPAPELPAALDAGAELSPLRFPDGALTLNDRCPVRSRKLNPRMPPIFVNGKPLGFC